jgi:hypothetical protein
MKARLQVIQQSTKRPMPNRKPPALSYPSTIVLWTDARIRARSERAIAMLKTWKILPEPCCPRRDTTIVHAIPVLHHVEANRYAR